MASSMLALTLPTVALYAGSEHFLKPPIYMPGEPGATLPPTHPDTAELFGGQPRDPKADLGIPFEDVSFATEGGATLRGWFVPGRTTRVGVVAVHGAWLDRRDFLRRLPILNKAGYPVLLFDCRGHGSSDGPRTGPSFGVREKHDVLAASRFMREGKHIPDLLLFGESQGAASSILAAADDPAIAGVIAENSFARLEDLADSLGANSAERTFLHGVTWVLRMRTDGVDATAPIDVVSRIAPRPLLLLHGTKDDLIPDSHSKRLYDAAGEGRSLWLVDGGGHDSLVTDDPKGYEERITKFLRDTLPIDDEK